MTFQASVETPRLERKVNVLIVASSLWIGGAETVIRHLAKTIDRRRFNVTVCYYKLRGVIGDAIANAGIDVVAVTGRGGPRVDYLTFLKLRRLVRALNIDVLHTHTTHGLVDAALCKLVTPKLKVIHTFHFGNYPHQRPRILWMERTFSKVVDRLFAVGEAQRGQLKLVYGFADGRIRTIRNGVPLCERGASTAFRKDVAADSQILVGTIATLIEQKGLRDLLAVARRVRDRRDDVKFVIVGDGHLRAELERRCRELDLQDTVVLAGWVADASETALPAFDVFFQPSLWEAMSIVTLEAMAQGKPIVATRVGETPYIIEHEIDGLLTDPRDVDGMTAALMRVIDDAALRRRLGESARRRVEQALTVDHMTRAYEETYLEVLR